MKRLMGIIGAILVLVVVLTLWRVGTSPAKGEAVFAVSDAAADMGAVSDIELTIDGLRIRSEAGAWTTVNTGQQTFMLLDLRDRAAAELLARASLAAGSYDRLELQVSKAVVTDASGRHEAKIPGNKLQLEGEMEVQAGATATANFDFLADKSLHMTGNGQYIFAPVVLLETRRGVAVEVQANNEVKVTGGSISTRLETGMDVHGNVDAGLRIAPDAVLSLSASGTIVQTGGQALVSGTIKAVDITKGTVTILTQGGTEVTLSLANNTGIKVDGSAATAADLDDHVGARVNVEYNAATNAAASMAIGASAAARSEVGSNLNVSGTIKSVDSARGSITLLTDAGIEVVLRTSQQSNISLDGSLLSGLLGLQSQVGANVEADYDARTGTITRLQAQGGAEAHANVTTGATLNAVNVLIGKITVATESGSELVLSLPFRARVLVDGSWSSVAVLATKIGSQVIVTYNADTKVVGSIAVQSTADVSAEGTLTAVNTVAGTVTVTTEAGAVLVVNVSSSAQVLVNGAVGAFADIAANVGSEVTVTYDAQSNIASSVAVRSTADASATGTLTAVDAIAGTITITTGAGADLVLDVYSSAEVLINGQVSGMVGLAASIGSEATVTYDAETYVASSVGIQGSAAASVTGTLTAVNVIAGTVTVTTQAGTVLVLDVSSSAQVLIDGEAGSIAILAARIFSQVTVTYDAETNVATRITA